VRRTNTGVTEAGRKGGRERGREGGQTYLSCVNASYEQPYPSEHEHEDPEAAQEVSLGLQVAPPQVELCQGDDVGAL